MANNLLYWMIVSIVVHISLISALTSPSSSRHQQDINDAGHNVFVSQRKGNDIPSCGPITNPCKTIVMGVWRATDNAKIYVDGTGSKTTPYNCKSTSLVSPGVNANKSLTIIGIQSMVYLRCLEGYHIKLDKSVLDNNGTVVSFYNITFINSAIQGQDISVFINDCIFSDSDKQAINVVQSSKPISIWFINSSCVNTSSCIGVNITHRVQPNSKVSIHLKNSHVLRSSGTTPNMASGIDVTSSLVQYGPGWITCDIALNNVTFKENNIGEKGLIFVNVENALTIIESRDVVFVDSIAKDNQPKNLITVWNSSQHDMTLINTNFTQKTRYLYRAIQVNADSQNKLYIMSSRFEGFVGGVLKVNSSIDTVVHIEDSTFQNNRGTMVANKGGCLSINSQNATVVIKDSNFTNNQAWCAGIMWLNVEDRSNVTINGCSFFASSATGPGGIASLSSNNVVHLTMSNTTVINTDTFDQVGVFDIGFTRCSKPVVIKSVKVSLDHMTVRNVSAKTSGLLAVLANTASVTVKDSDISDVEAGLGTGGVLTLQLPPPHKTSSTSKSMNYITYLPTIHTAFSTLILENVSISSVLSLQNSGGAIFIYEGAIMIIVNNSHFKNCVSQTSTGGVFYISDLEASRKSSMQINNSAFESNSAQLGGGAIYIGTSMPLRIYNSDFKFNSVNDSRGYGGAIVSLYSSLSSLQIIDSIFESNSASGCGGSIYAPRDVILQNVTFINSSSLNNAGGAICSCQGQSIALIQNCMFINNTALNNAGGAISFSQSQSIALIQNCMFINNTALNGGAVAFLGGNFTINESLFIDNFAKVKGGHIYLNSFLTFLSILDSQLFQQNSEKTLALVSYGLSNGLFIYSEDQGSLIAHNTTFISTSSWQHGFMTLVTVAKSKKTDFVGLKNQTVIMCPSGHEQDILWIPSALYLQITCRSCGTGTYSLQHGQSLGLSVVSGFQCLTCPFGAECINSIAAKSNFWGYKVNDNPVELNFTLCPIGYCGQTNKHTTSNHYNSCLGNRTGPLCGQCKDNYTETLLSPSCRHSDECTDKWIWVLTVVMVTLMALYLIYKPGLLHMLRKQIVWIPCKDEKENNQTNDYRSYSNTGYLKIVFYFYQIANILLVTTSYNTVVESYIMHPVVGIFNFQFRFSSSGFVCPFAGLTAVSKQVLMTSPVFGILLMIAVTYYCHCLLRKCKSKLTPNKGPYLGAVLETLLLGYMVFASTSLQLLRCKSIGGESSRLFISGDVVCYQGWQYVLMGFVGVVIFPFIFTLALGSRWLHNDTISVKEFLLGCVLPLPYLFYKLFWYLRGPLEIQHAPRNQRQHNVRDDPGEEPQDGLQCNQQNVSRNGRNRHQHFEPEEWKISILNILCGPFRDNSSCAVYWESVLVSRRLVVIIIFVIVNDPFSKELLLTLTCVAILFHHTIVQPFRYQAANIAEMTSLFSLVVIATINTFKASFLSIGQEPEGPLEKFAEIADWVQIVILLLVPVLCIVVVMVIIVLLVIRGIAALVTCLCCCKKSDDELRHLLEPSALDTEST